MNPEDTPTNSVLAVKLDYISKDIGSIKKDIADIKTDNIGRREFETHIKDSEEKIRARFLLSDSRIEDVSNKTDLKIKEVTDKADFINKVLYSVVALVVSAIIVAGLRLLLK